MANKLKDASSINKGSMRIISIKLNEDFIARLRKRGEKLGIGYQTYFKMIAEKYMDDEDYRNANKGKVRRSKRDNG